MLKTELAHSRREKNISVLPNGGMLQRQGAAHLMLSTDLGAGHSCLHSTALELALAGGTSSAVILN